MKNEIAFEMAASGIRFGAGVTREVGMDLADLGLRKALVITDPVLARLAPVETVKESLERSGIQFDLYDRVRVEPTDESFLDAIAFAKQSAYDAYVAPGVAYYVIGSLSSSTRFVLWFGGIHGDKQLGMSQVQKTADNGRYLKPFAQILLALSARREKQDTLAQKNLKALTEEFPGNTVYDTEYAKAMGRPIPATMGPAN